MSVETKRLKVFFLEDNPDDVELELYELKKSGFDVVYDVARNWKEFLDKLPNLSADIILADYSLPDITGIEAIALCRQMKIDIPVILITGEGNEMIAVDSLRLGAIDYLLKRNIAGLSARISRALEIWNEKKAKQRAEAEGKRLQELFLETQKMEAIGRLAGGIAHDFNNILTGIMGYSELSLQDAPKGSPLYQRLQSLIMLSQRGADLVKQLLIFSRKMPMECKTIELNSFVLETMQFISRMLEETIEIRYDLRKNLPRIECDTSQFTQVLMNLVLNARDAISSSGTITIKTEICSLTVDSLPVRQAEPGKEYVCLSVSDTGIGIDSENVQKIFEPFFTTKELGKGTGIGLSVVYSIVEAHGGFINVNSQKGSGTTIKIYLPFVETLYRTDESPFYDSIADKELGKVYGTETILFAEDEDVLRELIVYVLKSFGYNVLSARDGAEALDVYCSSQQKIDVVISDLMMPNKSGIDLFKELRALNPDVRFVLSTGYSLSEQDETVLEKMNAIVTKPYTPMQLAQLIRETMRA